MKVSLKKAFSLLDGRLSTEIGDVYEMLNYIFDENFMAHQLPTAMRELRNQNPEWYSKGVELIEEIKKKNNTNEFEALMFIIDKTHHFTEIEFGKLKADIQFLSGLV